MDPASYKRLKEEFVSNLAGSSKIEIFQVVSCLPLTFIFANALEAALHSTFTPLLFKPKHPLPVWASLIVEVLTIVLPQIVFIMPLVKSSLTFWMLAVLWLLFAARKLKKYSRVRHAEEHAVAVMRQLSQKHKRFISMFRGGLMLYTCLGILAVDFRAFPRRFAKVETFGTGHMDLGVGAIVFAAGLVSRAGTYDPSQRSQTLRQRMLSTLTHVTPLLILGFGRLAATKATGYHEHVGEYGLHWNFFFTAAGVSLVTSLVSVPRHLAGPLAALLLAAHQAALSRGGLSSWVMTWERYEDELLSANKEGLVSLPGYWALHLAGVAAGTALTQGVDAAVYAGGGPPPPGQPKGAAGTAGGGAAAAAARRPRSVSAWPLWRWLAGVAAADVALWAATWAVEEWVEPVSRRSCNAAFVLWTCAMCVWALLLCAATELLSAAAPTGSGGGPRFAAAFNRNMLLLFLLANLLTGAVNLSINTLRVADSLARVIVGFYASTLCWIAMALDEMDWTLKM